MGDNLQPRQTQKLIEVAQNLLFKNYKFQDPHFHIRRSGAVIYINNWLCMLSVSWVSKQRIRNSRASKLPVQHNTRQFFTASKLALSRYYGIDINPVNGHIGSCRRFILNFRFVGRSQNLGRLTARLITFLPK